MEAEFSGVFKTDTMIPQSNQSGSLEPAEASATVVALAITTNTNGALVVSSLDYAAGLDIQHKNLLETIRTHKEAIEADFGTIAFETRKSDGRPTTVAYLTEDQALFIGTLSRNSKRVIEFKATLVRAFSQARKQQEPQPEPIAPALSATEQLMLQLVQQNAVVLQNQQVIIERLQGDVASMQRGQSVGKFSRVRPQMALPFAASAEERTPTDTREVRRIINRRVSEYCGRNGCTQQDAFRYLYKRMFSVYGFDPYRCNKAEGESTLEVVERYGQLNQLYALVKAEFTYSE